MARKNHQAHHASMAIMAIVAIVAIIVMMPRSAPPVEQVQYTFTEEPIIEQPVQQPIPEDSLPVVEQPVEIPEPLVEQAPTEIPEQEELSLTEQYLITYNELVEKVSYTVLCEPYGEVKVSTSGGVTKYRAQDQVFEYNGETNTVEESAYDKDVTTCHKKGGSEDWSRLSKNFIKDIQNGDLNAMNYVWRDDVSMTYKGCYILVGSSSKDNCLKNATINGTEVILEDFKFYAPDSPTSLLMKFAGQEPVKIEIGQRYRIRALESGTIQVDYLYFDNGDGTETRLYIHQYYKAPLRADILEEGILVGITYFDEITFN